MLEVWAIGGYSQIGKNMTAIRIDDEVVILDMGLWMDKIVAHESEEPLKKSAEELIKIDAIPDDRLFFSLMKNKVKAIVISHAHLDHVGAVVKLAQKYRVPIIGTPFTIEVLRNLIKDQNPSFNGKLIKLNSGSTYRISENIELEFIHATHSTPQTVFIVLHTKYGPIFYANDWKFDQYPIIGKRINYKRLRQLGREGVTLYISDSTRIDERRRTYSETVVKDMLNDIFSWVDGEAVFVTTFASHIARLSMLIKMARNMGREPVLLGRSMENYMKAAERAGIINVNFKIEKESKKINKILGDAEKHRDKYMLITTGCQGEENAVLTRIADGRLNFNFMPDDQVIFSSSVIPTEVIKAHRQLLEDNLKRKHVRIFRDVHVSGHAGREDHREMLKMLQPQYYIPTHGGIDKIASAVDLATEMGYELGKDVFILQDGQRKVIIE